MVLVRYRQICGRHWFGTEAPAYLQPPPPPPPPHSGHLPTPSYLRKMPTSFCTKKMPTSSYLKKKCPNPPSSLQELWMLSLLLFIQKSQCKYQYCCWQSWQFLTILTIFDKFWPFDNFDKFGNWQVGQFWEFGIVWQFLTIFAILNFFDIFQKIWQFWEFLRFVTIFDKVYNFWQFSTIMNFYNWDNLYHFFTVLTIVFFTILIIVKTILKTCDIWDTDNWLQFWQSLSPHN